MARRKSRSNRAWRTIDLHLHTPASSDYQTKDATYLDILKRAEQRGLDIIAFTDHNTVAGYRTMQEEIQQLELLESLNRLRKEEKQKLDEYRSLLDKVLVLPGFEFTATFGFHILGVFPPEKPIREIEHLLLTLNIPADKLDQGSATVGATSDVLTAYQVINRAGGIVIAAHANSSNGVAMRGFSFGGQTKIAYTQDPALHALEVTDLEKTGRRTTAAFFSGTKPEYPRRMHCIQGSDAHRLIGEKKHLGVGDRTTEVLINKVSFESLKDLFLSNDFARTRPRRQKTQPVYDFVRAAQEEGANIVQDFHPSMTVRGGNLYAIIADVCAFANTNGGTLYIGMPGEPKKDIPGISKPSKSIDQLESEISKRISPPISVSIDAQKAGTKRILRILVPKGDDAPYAVDDNKIYVRSEAETGLAVRDEIVELVRQGLSEEDITPKKSTDTSDTAGESDSSNDTISPPRTGVEVVAVEERKGTKYYTMRDLRNGNVVKNVTHSSARRLWHYAIKAYDKVRANPKNPDINWLDDIGLVTHQKQGRLNRYDLIQRTKSGNFRYYFGVTEDGIHGQWKILVGNDEDDSE